MISTQHTQNPPFFTDDLALWVKLFVSTYPTALCHLHRRCLDGKGATQHSLRCSITRYPAFTTHYIDLDDSAWPSCLVNGRNFFSANFGDFCIRGRTRNVFQDQRRAALFSALPSMFGVFWLLYSTLLKDWSVLLFPFLAILIVGILDLNGVPIMYLSLLTGSRLPWDGGQWLADLIGIFDDFESEPIMGYTHCYRSQYSALEDDRRGRRVCRTAGRRVWNILDTDARL